MTSAALLGMGNGCHREGFLESQGPQAIGAGQEAVGQPPGERAEAVCAAGVGGEGGKGNHEWVLEVAG